jgi:hypothetical protein
MHVKYFSENLKKKWYLERSDVSAKGEKTLDLNLRRHNTKMLNGFIHLKRRNYGAIIKVRISKNLDLY